MAVDFDYGPKPMRPDEEDAMRSHLESRFIFSTGTEGNKRTHTHMGAFLAKNKQELKFLVSANWSMRLLSFPPSDYEISMGEKGIVEVRRKGVDLSEEPVERIEPRDIRFLATYYPTIRGVGDFLQPNAPISSETTRNVFCLGFRNEDGLPVRRTPAEVNHELKRMLEGGRPRIYTTHALVRIESEQKRGSFRVLELSPNSKALGHARDQVVMTLDYEPVRRNISYPLHPDKWGVGSPVHSGTLSGS